MWRRFWRWRPSTAAPVDLHTDGADPARLARISAMAGGLRPGVALAPCGGLARLPAEVASRAADQLAAAGVAVVCLPQGGCGAMERRGTAPVRLLRAAGVRVAAGSGALRDVSNPVGRGDPLEAAYLLASRDGLRPEEAYDAVSASARAVLGLPKVRVEAGFPAELVAVRGRPAGGGAVAGVQPDRGASGAGGGADERGTGVLQLGRGDGSRGCRGRGAGAAVGRGGGGRAGRDRAGA
ncbi:hypothetical protein SALBM311S_06494 [Streptomyces alboniger]